MLASEGKSKPEGLCGTCKTGTTPGMIVVNTAVNISMCCFSNILGGVIYAVTPNPVASLGVAILITNISVALLTIVLYLRYGYSLAHTRATALLCHHAQPPPAFHYSR